MNLNKPPPPKRLLSNAAQPPALLHIDCHDPNLNNLDKRTAELCQFVFNIDLLREKILEYAILDEKGDLSLKYAASYRQVQMSWLDYVTKRCYKSEKPLFSFSVGRKHQNHEGNRGGSFSQFVDAYASSLSLLPRIPPFSLDLHLHSLEINTPETHDKVRKCLQECNCGLVFLSLNIGGNCDSTYYPPAINRLSLPSLLSFNIETPYVTHDKFNLNYRFNAMVLIQSIVAGARQLKRFTVQGNHHMQAFLPGFQSLRLPTSIVEVEVNWAVAHTVMERLIMVNVLPELQHLTINVVSHFFDTGTLYNITNKLRLTLTELTILGKNYSACDHENVLQLPLLESLKRFCFSSGGYRWPEGIFGLETIFPNLLNLKLNKQPDFLLRRWMERSRFENMKQLDITLYRHYMDFYNNPEMFTLEFVTLIHEAFPNLTDLTITLPNKDDISTAIQYIFRNMPKLEQFCLCLALNHTRRDVHPLFWDSLVLGVPLDTLRRLQIHGKLIDLGTAENMLQEKKNLEISITNLSQLKKLSLMSPTYLKSCSLISDRVFQSTFLRMDNLHELNITGGIKVSKEMKIAWTEAGRKIRDQ